MLTQADLFTPRPATLDGDRDGMTFDPHLDGVRLNKQAQAVYDVIRDGQWRTLAQIAVAAGCPEASASARLRDLRKEKFGGRKVERKRDADKQGLWWYRLVIPT